MKPFLTCLAVSGLLLSLPAISPAAAQVGVAPKESARPRAHHEDKYAAARNSGASFVAAAEAAIVVEQDYEPDPAIWKLADEDTTIYLFGTFHVLPPEFKWRSARFDAIVEEVDELVVETSDEDGGDGMEYAMKLISGLPDRTPTSERLSPDSAKKWLALGKNSDMPMVLFDRMPPIISMLGLGIALTEEMGSDSEYGVETILEAEFAQAGKPILSIEDGNKIFDNLLAIPDDLLIADLESELAKWDGKEVGTFFEAATQGEDGAEETADPFDDEHRWAKGQSVGRMDFGESAFAEAFEKVLLEDRNRAWAEWLEKRLETPGKVLVAVGAGHFEGDVSVQVMLEERQLEAVRLN